MKVNCMMKSNKCTQLVEKNQLPSLFIKRKDKRLMKLLKRIYFTGDQNQYQKLFSEFSDADKKEIENICQEIHQNQYNCFTKRKIQPLKLENDRKSDISYRQNNLQKYVNEGRYAYEIKFNFDNKQYKRKPIETVVSEKKIFNPKKLIESNVIVQGSYIKNMYSQSKVIPIEIFSEFNLEFMICGALNENSGIDIVWGLTKESFKVKGIEIDEQSFIKTSEYVQIALKNIFDQKNGLNQQNSQNILRMRLIPVFNIFNNSYNEEYNLSVICLSVKAKNRLCKYVEKQKKYHAQYSTPVYFKNQFHQLKGQDLYKGIHMKFMKENKQQDIKSNRISSYFSQESYKYVSIMSVGSRYQEYLLDNFKRQLEEKQKENYICKPWPKYRKNSKKKIWVISHQDKFSDLDQIRASITDQRARIAFFAADCYLIVDQKCQKDYLDNLFKNQRQLINQNFNFFTGKNLKNDEQKYFFHFSSIKAAVFAFIFLDNEKVKTKFQKADEINKLKNIKKYDSF